METSLKSGLALDYLSNVYLRLIYKDSVLLIVLDEEEKKNE